jgi:hypothetical protein
MEQPICCICTRPCEPWIGGHGYGHNPAPLGHNDDDRCCDQCNAVVVMPARIQRLNAMEEA